MCMILWFTILWALHDPIHNLDFNYLTNMLGAKVLFFSILTMFLSFDREMETLYVDLLGYEVQSF